MDNCVLIPHLGSAELQTRLVILVTRGYNWLLLEITGYEWIISHLGSAELQTRLVILVTRGYN